MTINILVVDRGGRVQDMLRETLTPLECQIIPASSSALAMFLARKNFPSLIVLNLSKDDDDYDLPQEISADAELSHIPVVVLVPPNNPILENKVRALGATRVAPTPDSAELLRSLLIPFLVEQKDNRLKETTE